MNNLKSLKEEIADLNAFNLQLQHAAELDLKLMRDATAQANEVLRKVNELLQWKAYNHDLDDLMRTMLGTITQLHMIASGHAVNPPSPNKMMAKVTKKFDSFFDLMISRERRNKLHDIVITAPYIGKVVHFCEFVPSCWSYCNKTEKMAIVLSATLAVTAIAVLIAVQCSPAIAALPVVAPAMNALLSLSAALYTKVMADALVKHDNQKAVRNIRDDLQSQKKFLQDCFDSLAPDKSKIATKESITYASPTKRAASKRFSSKPNISELTKRQREKADPGRSGKKSRD